MEFINEYNVEHLPQMETVMKEIELAKELKLLPFIDDSYECDNAYCELVMASDYFEENNFIRTKALGFWLAL